MISSRVEIDIGKATPRAVDALGDNCAVEVVGDRLVYRTFLPLTDQDVLGLETRVAACRKILQKNS